MERRFPHNLKDRKETPKNLMNRNRTPPHPSLVVERHSKRTQPAGYAFEVKEFRVAEFTPQDTEQGAELHLIMRTNALEHPVVTRFKGPDTLGYLIEELISYKQRLWPDSPMPFPLDADTLEQVTDTLAEEAEDASETLKAASDAPTI